ncbi:MAG: cytochrome c biogenesis CcdA family protein [Candidatus Aenigmatarchaeota archaeon]
MKKIFLLLFPLLSIPTAFAQEFYHPFLGNISNLPLILVGILTGLADGIFNPCALSVLFFMVAYILALGSRRKILLIGFSYSIMIFLVYFSFMYLLTQAISITTYYIGYVQLMRYIIGGILTIFGVLEIKDFFFYGKGLSLEIPKFAKPKIEKLVKSATLPSAILLGLLVSLVEIPCAGAFPLLYASFINSSLIAGTISWAEMVFYLIWYNIFFVVPLLALTLIFYFGFLKVEEAEKKRIELRKYMRLAAGIILIAFGVAFFVGWV